MGEMTKAQINGLAARLVAGAATTAERVEFRQRAKDAGYVGRPGGWIYNEQTNEPIAQGWQAFASRVCLGYVTLGPKPYPPAAEPDTAVRQHDGTCVTGDRCPECAARVLRGEQPLSGPGGPVGELANDPCESVYRTQLADGWSIRHMGPVRLYRYLSEPAARSLAARSLALCGWHANMYGDLIAPVLAPRKLAEVERGHVNALTKAREVLEGWIASVRDNADAMGRNPDDAESDLSVEDFRVMLVDAARQLGVLDEFRREIKALS